MVEALRGRSDTPDEICDAGSFVPGWLRADYHRFLCFAGLQSKREAVGREADGLREALGEHESSCRRRGADLQREAAEQRAKARRADESVLESRAESAAAVKERAEEYRHHREHVHALRAEYALVTAEARRWAADGVRD